MLEFIKDKKDCTGCSACYAACPVHCIEMQKDEEGFYYPVANDKCVRCKKCERICPIHNKFIPQRNESACAFAGVSNDKVLWSLSSSGGAFGEICRCWGDKDTIVVGAAWDDAFSVHHTCIKGIDNILPFHKSKYIQSRIENVFIEVEHALKNNAKVIFSGVPCQVAGLKSFLGRNYSNLLTIDLICHGAGSIDVFQDSIALLEKRIGKQIARYGFRPKRSVDEKEVLLNRSDQELVFLKNDPYFQLFINQLCIRKSCGEHCIFRNENRQGDITIADFKHIEKVSKEFVSSDKNYSTIVLNTAQGKDLFDSLNERMDLREVDIDIIKKYNPLFYRHTISAHNRDAFFNDYNENHTGAIVKWTKPIDIYNERSKNSKFYKLPRNIRLFVILLLEMIGMMKGREYLKESEFENCNKTVVVVQNGNATDTQ